MTMADDTRNDTEDDELDELDRLLRAKLIEGLKAESPPASLLAVAQKVLAARKDTRPPQRHGTDLSNLPFPRADDDERPASATAGQEEERTKALQQPWVGRLPFPRPSIGAPHD